MAIKAQRAEAKRTQIITKATALETREMLIWRGEKKS
jgi:hypothetical protein